MGPKTQNNKIKYNPTEPVAVWMGKDLFDFNQQLESVTIILRTVGCYWKRCTMCGYFSDCATTSHDEIMQQLDYSMGKFPDDDFILKIFTSGSFFCEKEIAANTRNDILSKLSSNSNVKKVIVESRPEFVRKDVISECMDFFSDFEIGIGVETSDDLIRDRCINKGFTFKDFQHAAEIANRCGAKIKAYLLLKPPYLSEKEAIEDTIKSAKDVSAYASTISINLCNVQNATKVHELWKNGCYRPPWLWSAVEVLKKVKSEIRDVIISSDPLGAGSKRGPHNCKKCDRKIADAINSFSLSQDISVFDQNSCECEELFQRALDLEKISFGSPLVI